MKFEGLKKGKVFYAVNPVGCILILFVSSHIFPHISNVLALKQTATILMFRWFPSVLSPEPQQFS